MKDSVDTSSSNAGSTEGSPLRIDPEHGRVKLLREMLRMASDPHDPDRGIHACDNPFARIAIERLKAAFPESSGYWSSLERVRKKSGEIDSVVELPPFGGTFHAAMLTGFRYAELIFNEWIEMQNPVPSSPPISEGLTDGSCTS